MSAQKAPRRRYESGNTPCPRLKAMIPILMRCCPSAPLRRTDELAAAMKCRCYRGEEQERASSSFTSHAAGHNGLCAGTGAPRGAVIALRCVDYITAIGEPICATSLCFKYNGMAYHGWQVQKKRRHGRRTRKSCGCGRRAQRYIAGCGRTDAGVHARCYVAIPHRRRPSRQTASRLRSTAACRDNGSHLRYGRSRRLQRHRLVRAEGIHLF